MKELQSSLAAHLFATSSSAADPLAKSSLVEHEVPFTAHFAPSSRL